jgi:hypothetical protein
MRQDCDVCGEYEECRGGVCALCRLEEEVEDIVEEVDKEVKKMSGFKPSER